MMTTPNIQLLLSRLRKVRRVGQDKWMACCPAHDDGTPSLSVGVGDDGRVLLHCFGQNCGAAAIVAAVGMDISDLFPASRLTDRAMPRMAAHVPGHMLQVARNEVRDAATAIGVLAIAMGQAAADAEAPAVDPGPHYDRLILSMQRLDAILRSLR